MGENRRLTAIIESSERAAALTSQLLAYAGKAPFQVTDFDVSRLVRSTADLIRVSIPKSRPATVMVVEDEEPVSAVTKAALETLGYRVVLAENGRKALELLDRNFCVDLVVLDVTMPVMGGVETLSKIRRKWPELAILVASGHGRHEVQQLGIPAWLPFLQKPYTIHMLADAVAKALQSCPGSHETGKVAGSSI